MAASILEGGVMPGTMSPAEVRTRVERRWDLSGPFPAPRWTIECPCCRSTEVRLRQCSFHKREQSPAPHRCDVSFKCTDCSLAFSFGVPIPERMYRGDEKRIWTWREVRVITQRNMGNPTLSAELA